jgi:hypothetical protein
VHALEIDLFSLEHTRFAEERDPKYNEKTGRALLLLVLHSHFCQQSLKIQVGHSLADRARASSQEYHQKREAVSQQSRNTRRLEPLRRPANPSRLKKDVHKREYINGRRKKELHHGRIRGAARRHCVTTPKRDKFESKGSKHIFFGSFSVPEFYVGTRRT